jgi:AcrR family transcriptional regulator
MGRWQPGTRDRLHRVAVELIRTHGYEATTVADIAEAAEVTERTFYRYFADKREVLFDGQELLTSAFVDAVAGAPAEDQPMQLAAAALDAAAAFFTTERRAWSRARQQAIDSDPALQERELLKLAALATSLAGALRDRGVADPQAGLCADAALSVFKIAFTRWLAPGETRSMADLQRETLATLRGLTTDPGSRRRGDGRTMDR